MLFLAVVGFVLLSCGSSREQAAVERSVSYLEEIVPPCTPIRSDGPDPCPLGTPPRVRKASSQASSYLRDPLPTFTEVLLDSRFSGPPFNDTSWVFHMVVRGTIIPGTTRCELYPMILPNISTRDEDQVDDLAHYHCFADVRVSEYLIGEGPPKLTVSVFRDTLFLDFWESYRNVTDEQILLNFDDAASRTADAYEGREMFLFLRLPSTIAVEAWVAGYKWFVQRRGDDLRVVSPNIRRAETPEQRNRLDMAYTEFIRQVKQASENRIEITGGRVGTDPSLPLLVTDANYLHDFYGAVGAVYEGRDATVLPPPSPGGIEDPSLEGPARVGEDETEGDGPVVPGEETTTSTTDETTTTTTDETTTSSSATTAATTTTTSAGVTTTTGGTTVPTAPTTTTSVSSTTASTTVSTTTPSTTAAAAAVPGSVRRFSVAAGDGNIAASWTEPRSDGVLRSPAMSWSTG